jgi:saccharopine dehydrogenase-like NADP-dependent oxidoreductase
MNSTERQYIRWVNKILVIGAGRSSIYLIEYLHQYAQNHQYQIVVCDQNTTAIQNSLSHLNGIDYLQLSIQDESAIEPIIQCSKVVVSLLPAFLHIQVAKLCLKYKTHLATASYISPEMKALDAEVKHNDLIFLNEMGLDPGIDHMSAMHLFDQIRQSGGKITGFKSFCGGLVADEDDGDNPWRYKFSWNPRNVILAAQGGEAIYLQDHQQKSLHYNEVFNTIQAIEVPGYGLLEAYANRDSVSYKTLYGLDDVKDLLRGTFRKPGFCLGWDTLIQFGLTNTEKVYAFEPNTSLREFYQRICNWSIQSETDLINLVNGNELLCKQLLYIGCLSDQSLPKLEGSAADLLEAILVQKWALRATDKDLVVMMHDIAYTLNGKAFHHYSSLVLKGENAHKTAMAKTVGLPLAIGVKLILENAVQERGVLTPMYPSIYLPVLKELAVLGIVFHDSLVEA